GLIGHRDQFFPDLNFRSETLEALIDARKNRCGLLVDRVEDVIPVRQVHGPSGVRYVVASTTCARLARGLASTPRPWCATSRCIRIQLRSIKSNRPSQSHGREKAFSCERVEPR